MKSLLRLLCVLIAFASAALAEPTELVNSLGMKLVRIEPGSFSMGQDGPPADHKMIKHPAKFDDADWDERPAHRVTISTAFSIGATEVTLGQYRQWKPQHAGGRGAEDDAAHGVSWKDAVEFCRWLSAKEGRPYRLPTEAEWEYACRAGTATLFNTGDALPDGFQPWVVDAGKRSLVFGDGALPPVYRAVTSSPGFQVGQTAANAWGLFDMHGNVAEWCSDWYGPYETGEQTDPLGRADGDFRVFRGGSHLGFVRLLRSANRGAWIPESESDEVGFRVVLGELPQGRLLPVALPPLHAQNVSQSIPKFQPLSPDVPIFAGPRVFLKVPPEACGPMYAWHNHSPGITECPNGDLLAVWFSCVEEVGSELCNLASRLRHGSEEWEPASPFWDGPDVNDHAPKLWWDGQQTLFHFARGLAEDIVRTSTDNGATWSKARVLMPHGELGNQLLRLKDGTLVFGHDVRSVSLVFSKDGGQSWQHHEGKYTDGDFRNGGKGPRYPGIHAPLVELADGRIMAISRNDQPPDQAKWDRKSPFSFTSNLGESWTYQTSEFPAISSVQRQVLMRLHEGPILLCTYTDQRRDWDHRKGLPFRASDGSEFTGYGLFAALSFDEGQTWPVRKLLTPGGPARTLPTIDRGEFTLSETMAEPAGYLTAIQSRDGNIQLLSSKNHYTFNLAWLKQLPPSPAH